MIKKFNEFIEEGLWSKGLERAQTGNMRIENTNPQFQKYLENVKWVDMKNPDVLYSEFDFTEGMTLDEIRNLKLPDGVSIMDGTQFYWLKGVGIYGRHTTTIPEVDCKVYSITNDVNLNKIYFNVFTDVDYEYVTDINDDDPNIIAFSCNKLMKYSKFVKENLPILHFKLVKKKSINEGLWSKGLERAQTGDKRKEKYTFFDEYISSIKWIDMGHPEYLFAEYDFNERELSIQEINDFEFHRSVKILSSQVFDFLQHNNISKDLTNKCDKIEFKNNITNEKIYFLNNDNYITNFSLSDEKFKVDVIDFFPKGKINNESYNISNIDSPMFNIKLIKYKNR